MIVSHQHRYVFVQVPHTGCTAVAKELCERYGGEPYLGKHDTYGKLLREGPRELQDYFVFASVRNPLDVAVTKYFKLRSNHRENMTTPSRWVENGGWVTPADRRRFAFVRDTGADFATYFEWLRPEVYTLRHSWFFSDFDAILRFEHLAEDFDAALRRIGITPDRPLPVYNQTSGKGDFLAYYTPAVRASAVAVYGPFMRKWGYPIPAGWPTAIPLASRVRFAAMEAVGPLLVKRLRWHLKVPPIVRRLARAR